MRKKSESKSQRKLEISIKQDRENYRLKRLLTSSNRATIVCTYEEQHKLAAQKNLFP